MQQIQSLEQMLQAERERCVTATHSHAILAARLAETEAAAARLGAEGGGGGEEAEVEKEVRHGVDWILLLWPPIGPV
jgi:ribosome-interacting GTPase 1